MESAEREGNINTVEQLQNTEVNTEHIPANTSSKKQKQSHGGIYSCDQCEFNGSRSGLQRHKKAKHEGVRYPCGQCEYFASNTPNLRRHMKTKHESRYPCDQCEHVATKKSSLNQHKRSKHEGVRNQCEQCEYTATRKAQLKAHKESKHGEYMCDQCEFAAPRLSKLNRHKRVKHFVKKSRIFEFKCDMCDYVASHSKILKLHRENGHFESEQINCKSSKKVVQLPEYVSVATSSTDIEESEIKEENVDDPLSLVEIEPIENDILDPAAADVSANIKPETDICDFESIIDIEEDMKPLI